jgi:hypothetical protein
MGPLGLFHAEAQEDVCQLAPAAQPGSAASLEAASRPPVPDSRGHCAVCHWMHSLRAFGVSPLVLATAEQVAAPVAPASFAATSCGVTTLRSSRAPPALA